MSNSLEDARAKLRIARDAFCRRPDAYWDGMCSYYARLVAKLEKEQGTK